MSVREWKPGDVAVLTHEDGSTRRAMLGVDRRWHCFDESGRGHTPVAEVLRPLVVLDPDDRCATEALRDEFDRQIIVQNDDPDPRDVSPGMRGNALSAALRSLVTPPKPDEPMGLGAVVKDAEGALWTSVTNMGASDRWQPNRLRSDKARREWDQIAAVKVLSPGVTP